MSSFAPVATLDDLDSLDADAILAGYLEHNPGDPEPGLNHGRAYWHGWTRRARDRGEMPQTPESARLAGEYLRAERMEAA
jgi:hypothetical protein